MDHQSAAARPHTPPAGESRDHYELVRDVSETRGEVRVLKWACALALVAFLGAMGALHQHQHQQELGRNIQEVQEDVGRIAERTINLDKRLDVIEEMVRMLVARTASNP